MYSPLCIGMNSLRSYLSGCMCLSQRILLIVVIYQCCAQPTNLTGNSAFSQQEILLSQMDRPTINPRANFYQDICKLIQNFQTKNPHCIPKVMGDWNDTCQGTFTSAKICRKFGLVDIWSYNHPDTEFRQELSPREQSD